MTDASGLDDFDIQVLRACAGMSNTLNGWGAAVDESASALKHRGLLEGYYRITDAGRAALAKAASSQTDDTPQVQAQQDRS